MVFCLGVFAGCQGPPDPTGPPNSSSEVSTPSAHPGVLDPPYTLAILPFENLSPHTHLNWLRRGLQEMLVSDLAKWPRVEVVSREALGPVLREQWFQQRGYSSDGNSVKPGHLKGVRYLIQGRIYSQDEALSIDLQVIDVETGVIVSSVKAQGVESDIPSLEQNLVTQTINLFGTSLTNKSGFDSMETPVGRKSSLNSSFGIQEKREKEFSPEEFHLPSVHQIDAFLELEKLTHQRREAYHLAETIWDEGWSTEMGQPFYHVWQHYDQTMRSVPIMAIPISLFLLPNRVANIYEKVWKSGVHFGLIVDSDGLRIQIDEESGANQLFVEQFHKPRRVFVRALNEQGDVLAIYSDWAWRTESKIQMRNHQRLGVPLWPEPFITGLAEFPVDWVEREGHHVTFDAVVVPIPDEQVFVMLEPLAESDEERGKTLEMILREKTLLQTLERKIRSHWCPAIIEGLPTFGYLPGNKRTAVGVVGIQDGKIIQLKFQKWPDEIHFLKSLNDLKVSLLGLCVECQDSDQVVSSPSAGFKSFRLQLTLVKDINALQLGSRSS